MAGIDEEARTVRLRYFDEGDETAAPQLARLGEDGEEVEAQLLVAAIWQWLLGAPAMARRSSSTDAVVLGLGFAVDTERERGEKPGAQVEGLVPDLILAQQRPGWTETACAGGRATARVATAR